MCNKPTYCRPLSRVCRYIYNRYSSLVIIILMVIVFSRITLPNTQAIYAQDYYERKGISLDLNSIEKVWGTMKAYLRTEIKPKTTTELKEGIKAFWKTLAAGKCCKYIGHLQKSYRREWWTFGLLVLCMYSAAQRQLNNRTHVARISHALETRVQVVLKIRAIVFARKHLRRPPSPKTTNRSNVICYHS